MPTDHYYEDDCYGVLFEVTSNWDNHYNAIITVTNNSDETIHNWSLIMNSSDKVTNLYNAFISAEDYETGYVLLTNAKWNRDIEPGASVSFGYTGEYGEESGGPDNFMLVSCRQDAEDDRYEIETATDNSWDTGAIMHFSVVNTGEKAITDWSLSFTAPECVTDFFGMNYEYDNGRYTVYNKNDKQDIEPGETLDISFMVQYSVSENETGFTEFKLSEVTSDDEAIQMFIDSYCMDETKEEAVSEDAASENMVSEDNADDNEEAVVSENSVSENSVSDNTVSENIVSDNSVSIDAIYEGIQYFDAEPGVGLIYYKPSNGNIEFTPEGHPCRGNQMLLSVDNQYSFDYVNAEMESIGAGIVGYIETINEYQVEFFEYHDTEEIQSIIDELTNCDWIETVNYNYILLEKPQFSSTDPWGDYVDIYWDSSNPSGNNWGIEDVDLYGAFREIGIINNDDSINYTVWNSLSTSGIGVIDSMFDEWTGDLDFKETWHNVSSENEIIDGLKINPKNTILYHGTHVAGTMAATFDNGIGTNGIAIKSDLYGFAIVGDGSSVKDSTENQLADSSQYVDADIFTLNVALGILIENNVKVINYSYGFGDELVFAASQEFDTDFSDYARDYISKTSGQAEVVLSAYLDLGYDFLIVCAAGNTNDKAFYKTGDGFGFTSVETADSIYSGYATYGGIHSGADNIVSTQAKYDSALTYISNEAVKQHIICVGSYGIKNKVRVISEFSNTGDRVDIYAPGEDIYSTFVSYNPKEIDPNAQNTQYSINGITYYMYSANGTSMAAPHVSGAAGLALSVVPGASMTELKKIIKDSAENKDGVQCLNVYNVVNEIEKSYVPSDKCRLEITVQDEAGDIVKNADIKIYLSSVYWYVRMGAAFVSDAYGEEMILLGESTYNGVTSVNLPEGTYYVVANENDEEGDVYCIQVTKNMLGENESCVLTLKELTNNYCGIIIQVRDGSGGQNGVNVTFYDGWNNPCTGNPSTRVPSVLNTYTTQTTDNLGRNTGNLHMSIKDGFYTIKMEYNSVTVYRNIFVLENEIRNFRYTSIF